MKIIEDLTPGPFTRQITVGVINQESLTLEDLESLTLEDLQSKEESTVIISEKNFKHILSLIPRTNESVWAYDAVKKDIQSIKDSLTELSFKTTAELSRDLLTYALQSELDKQTLYSDILAFEKITKHPPNLGDFNV